MKKKTNQLLITFIILMTMGLSHAAKPVACTGVSKQCTTDVRFDKTIEGQSYSCYECKQTVCKSGGSGPIAGTETSTVCESKAASGKALIQSQQVLQFDEADSLFGKRTEVKGAHPPPSDSNTVNNRTPRRNKTVDNRSNKTVKKTPKRGTKGPAIDPIIAPNNRNTNDYRKNKPIQKKTERGTKRPTTNPVTAPSQVTLYDVTSDSLSISWMDNDYHEYGVSVERGTPEKDRGGINYNWQHVFNVEERMDDNVKGTGWRTDGDDGLSSKTAYCYRLRAYYKKQYSAYSPTVCTTSK